MQCATVGCTVMHKHNDLLVWSHVALRVATTPTQHRLVQSEVELHLEGTRKSLAPSGVALPNIGVSTSRNALVSRKLRMVFVILCRSLRLSDIFCLLHVWSASTGLLYSTVDSHATQWHGRMTTAQSCKPPGGCIALFHAQFCAQLVSKISASR